MMLMYVLNLREDVSRLERIAAQADGYDHLRLHRIDAVRGSLLPDLACLALTKNSYSVKHKGALGCFLSHIQAWEQVAKSRDHIAMIIEDDVRLTNLETARDMSLPSDL